jgi:CBS domain containing-hemolysin-like protein
VSCATAASGSGGDVALEDVNERFDLGLETEIATTIGGYVLTRLGGRPRKGDRIEVPGASFAFISVDDQGLQLLVLEKRPA